jgi:hypothetical protein
MADAMAKAARRVAKIAFSLKLPELGEGTSYGTPALVVRGKSFARLKDAETLVLMLSLEHKEFLIEAAPEIYFETDHYKGWPAVLVRLSAISDEELGRRLTEAWRHRAPKRLAAGFGG